MIPQRWIESYLRFLLRYRRTVVVAVGLLTAFFGYALTGLRLHTDFFDFYPRKHPYIQFYNEFRRMFGTANIMSVILEVKHGDIFNPETLQKLDRITRYLIYSKGVVPYQIFSIAHPAVNSVMPRQGAIQVRPIFFPRVPQTQQEADIARFAVYANPTVRGVYVARDDTAAVVHAAFWEEALDFRYLYQHLTELQQAEEDDNHRIYITGFPWLYTCVLNYADQLYFVFGFTLASLAFLLYAYFHTWTGILVPLLSAVLSSVWGLGMASLLGFTLDPLVLVIPIFLTARALSHSVQSMDRYHEEYYRLQDRQQAIVVSYSHLFAPAIAAIVTDGVTLLVVAVAPIPIIQKVAIFASFWVVSIFVSVVTLHPIILSYIKPPPARRPWRITERFYDGITQAVIASTQGWYRWLVVGLTAAATVVLPFYGWRLKVGDMTPGAALLYADHPYNIGYRKLNEKFLGASQLIVIADTHRIDGIKAEEALREIEEFADHMSAAEGAGPSLSVVDVVKQVSRTLHDGDPKWSSVPVELQQKNELLFAFTYVGQGRGELFMDPTARYSSVVTLFHDYSNALVTRAIEWAKKFDRDSSGPIQFLYAGGIFGILAAVNDAVEQSYWLNLFLIFAIVEVCLLLTYGSFLASLILLVPVVLSQLAAEAFMVWFHIDLNVNSLPIAAAGAGVGVDYGIYHFSRMAEAMREKPSLDEAVDFATATTGKAIIFTASTMIAATIFWWLSDLKFQSEMGMLLALLMLFNTFGGLVIVPALVKTIRPTL